MSAHSLSPGLRHRVSSQPDVIVSTSLGCECHQSRSIQQCCRVGNTGLNRVLFVTQADKKKPLVVKYGINHITTLIESGKAQLVVIAHDVDPLELVLWLPALCKKMGVPYAIVKVRRDGRMNCRVIFVRGLPSGGSRTYCNPDRSLL